jgi:uncharacterized protein (DUF2252 family)
MTRTHVVHRTVAERREIGKKARKRFPREALAEWAAAKDRPDPMSILEAQDATREPDLVPVRHGRMLVSPFTFYRGAAAIMAVDLRELPRAGLTVQLCGDAHLSNFGAYASPERQLLFDVNDFDETLPGPFEYDVARLAASFVVAARNNGFAAADARACTMQAVSAYRLAMREFAGMRTLDIWYSRQDVDQLLAEARSLAPLERKTLKRGQKTIEKARTRDSLQALEKLTEVVDGRRRIVSDPPILIPARDIHGLAGLSSDDLFGAVHEQLVAYRSTLPDDRRHLLERFEFVDLARKVVGVGSVGTRAWIGLLEGRDDGDPLFLQVKEATASVLEEHLPKSRYKQPGERVVQGQRLMQAASDIFLGWTKGLQEGRFYYWRQLRDMKGSADIERLDPTGLTWYAKTCGWTLARAHARSGDPIAIGAYLGNGENFDRGMTSFAEAYADQNERDFKELQRAVDSGRMTAEMGV